MVYTDGELLVSDSSLEELHLFAFQIGLKKKWFQNNNIPHYQIRGSIKKKAIRFGAEFIDDKIEITRLGKRLRRKLKDRLTIA